MYIRVHRVSMQALFHFAILNFCRFLLVCKKAWRTTERLFAQARGSSATTLDETIDLLDSMMITADKYYALSE